MRMPYTWGDPKNAQDICSPRGQHGQRQASCSANKFGEEVDYDIKLALVCMSSWTLQGIFASVKDIKKISKSDSHVQISPQ